MNRQDAISAVIIPNSGFGDVLYACLFMKALSARDSAGTKPVVFTHATAAWLGAFAGVDVARACPFIHFRAKERWTHDLGQFIGDCRQRRGAVLYSTGQDVFDAAVAKLAGWTMATVKLANAYEGVRLGWRSKVNQWFKYNFRGGLDNPGHILSRYAVLAGAQENAGQLFSSLRQVFSQRLELHGIQPQPGRGIVIFADAGSYERDLTDAQLRGMLRAVGNAGDLTLVTSREVLCPELRQCRIVQIQDKFQGFRLAAASELVISTDSFPAHFSALMDRRLYVIYNTPKEPKYCESWGIPDGATRHFENGMIYLLSPDAKAMETTPEDNFQREIQSLSKLGCQQSWRHGMVASAANARKTAIFPENSQL